MTKVLALIAALAALAATTTAPAANTYTRTCFDLTTARGLDTKRVVNGLGLPPDLIRELRGRLASYNSVRNDFTLEGLGLTAAQITEIKRRIAVQVAEWNKYPLGWPCAPFKNPARVIKYVKAQLIYNGFRPAMTVRIMSTRQIRFQAIQDGQRYTVIVAKFGPREIRIAARCSGSYCTGGGSATYHLGFDA